MTKPLPPNVPFDAGKNWPLTIQAAVNMLLGALSQADKDEIAVMPEADLINLHFGLGTRIRDEFGLWQENRALLLDCQKAKFEGRVDVPECLLPIHPDDASMLIIRALWGRLRH